MMIMNKRHDHNNKQHSISYYVRRSLQFWALLALTTWCLFLLAQISITSRSLQDHENESQQGSTRLLLLLQQRKGQYHQHHQHNEEIGKHQQRGVVVHLETATQESLAAALLAAAAAAKSAQERIEQRGEGEEQQSTSLRRSSAVKNRAHVILIVTTTPQQQEEDDDDETPHESSEQHVDTDDANLGDDDDDDLLEEEDEDVEHAEENKNEQGGAKYDDEEGNSDATNEEEDMVDNASDDDDDDDDDDGSNENEQQWVPKAPQNDKNDIVHYNCTNEKGQVVTLQQVPAFIIIGAQKAGTSALHDLLNLHPHIQGSHEPEAHFFDRRLPINYLQDAAATNATWADEYRCKVREIYAKKFFPYEQLQDNPQVKFFDKTPAYITSTGAAFRVYAIAPWSKIILSLRNPVHRAFSQHRMEWLPQQAHLTFEERLGVSLDMLRQMPQYKNRIPATDPFARPSRELMNQNTTSDYAKIDAADVWKQRNMIHRGFYLEQLQPWLQYYTLGKNLLVVRYEEFQSRPEKVLHQILDFVGVERPPPGNSIYSNNVFLQQYGPGRQRASPGSSMAEVAPPTPDALEFLAQLYKPFNDELANVLGEEWRGVWD